MTQSNTAQTARNQFEQDSTPHIDVPLSSGRRINIDKFPEERVRVIGASGEVELSVRLTDDGPALSFKGADIDIASAGKVAVACDAFEVAAREVRFDASGDFNTTVKGNYRVRAKKLFETVADTLEWVATRGDATLKANDVVRMLGEKILLNSDKADPADQGKVIDFMKRMGLVGR